VGAASNLRDFFIFIVMAIVFINWLVGLVQYFSCRSPVLSLDLFMVVYDFYKFCVHDDRCNEKVLSSAILFYVCIMDL